MSAEVSYRQLPVKLTIDEVAKFSLELARTTSEESELEEEKKELAIIVLPDFAVDTLRRVKGVFRDAIVIQVEKKDEEFNPEQPRPDSQSFDPEKNGKKERNEILMIFAIQGIEREDFSRHLLPAMSR